MKKDMIIYDKNGEKLKIGDRLSDGYDKDNWLGCYYGDELYITGKRDMWALEEFRLEAYNGGIKLVDFEKYYELEDNKETSAEEYTKEYYENLSECKLY